jgi:two-component system, NtrC family, sensor histidine kinase HydH
LRSSADLLLREPKLTNEGKEVLGFIISETERLNKLVSTLIDAARPRTLNKIEVNLTEIAANAIALLKSQAQAKNITILFDASKAISCNADADQMTQVVMNLLMNALQILPNSGKIELLLQEKKDTDGNEMVIMDFMDDGPGILAENQAQIFEPFFTQRSGGVGLGLAVVRQIVQAHGGEISYQTSPQKGAQFSITLPKAHT